MECSSSSLTERHFLDGWREEEPPCLSHVSSVRLRVSSLPLLTLQGLLIKSRHISLRYDRTAAQAGHKKKFRWQHRWVVHTLPRAEGGPGGGFLGGQVMRGNWSELVPGRFVFVMRVDVDSITTPSPSMAPGVSTEDGGFILPRLCPMSSGSPGFVCLKSACVFLYFTIL